MTFGYIDPGQGSLLIQAFLAGLLAVPFILRSQIARVVSRARNFRRPRGGSVED